LKRKGKPLEHTIEEHNLNLSSKKKKKESPVSLYIIPSFFHGFRSDGIQEYWKSIHEWIERLDRDLVYF
jgi:hypothetical protein